MNLVNNTEIIKALKSKENYSDFYIHLFAILVVFSSDNDKCQDRTGTKVYNDFTIKEAKQILVDLILNENKLESIDNFEDRIIDTLLTVLVLGSKNTYKITNPELLKVIDEVLNILTVK